MMTVVVAMDRVSAGYRKTMEVLQRWDGAYRVYRGKGVSLIEKKKEGEKLGKKRKTQMASSVTGVLGSGGGAVGLASSLPHSSSPVPFSTPGLERACFLICTEFCLFLPREPLRTFNT